MNTLASAELLQVIIAPGHPGMPGTPGIPFEVVTIAQSFFTTVVIIALGIPIIRSLSRRFIERPPVNTLSVPPDVTARLERIEQAVEAVAIEVERISEAQRFSAKLLAGRGSDADMPPGDRAGAVPASRPESR